MNRFGTIFSLTSFGESHGPAIGGVIDGMPAGIAIDLQEVQRQLSRRRPGQSAVTTSRQEADKVDILSGMLDGVTTGTPIGFTVANTAHQSDDYSEMENKFRPSHADYTYHIKYGIRDYRGGGRSSARETVARVVAGAFARQALATLGVSIYAYTSQVGDIILPGPYTAYDLSAIDNNMRCPDECTARRMEELVLKVKSEGDTIGGVITGVIRGMPTGIGEPVFGRLNAMLASAMMSINAAKGFDIGMGFNGVGHRGSEMVDTFIPGNPDKIATMSNHSGGIQGGISNGNDIYFRVAFKPVATLMRDIDTVDINGKATVLHGRGRHDPCVLPRAVPVVEAMAAITCLDAYLISKTRHI